MKNKNQPIRTVRSLVQPDNDRRRILRSDMSAARTIDEEIYITRSRVSALNGVVNLLLADAPCVRAVKHLNWGIYGLVADDKKALKTMPISSSNVEKSDHILSVIYERIVGLKSAILHYDDDYNFYVGLANREGSGFVGGLARENKSEAAVGLLAALGIDVLLSKLNYQHQLLNQAESELSRRKTGFDKLVGPDVRKFFDED